MNINPLDVPGTPFVVEMLNPNPSSRRTKDGPVYRVSFEVSKEDHDAFMASRASNLRIVARMSVVPDTDEQAAYDAIADNGTKPKKERKPKEPKGPFGQLWKELYLAGFVNCPGVREVIEATRETTTEPAWEVLHTVFGAGSLATVGPDEIFAQFPQDLCPQVKTMVEQALRKAGEKQC